MLSGDYITGVFVGQIKQFDKMFSGTVFPPFADPEAQANKVAQDYWDQKMSEPCGPDGPDDDPGDIADDARVHARDEMVDARIERRKPARRDTLERQGHFYD